MMWLCRRTCSCCWPALGTDRKAETTSRQHTPIVCRSRATRTSSRLCRSPPPPAPKTHPAPTPPRSKSQLLLHPTRPQLSSQRNRRRSNRRRRRTPCRYGTPSPQSTRQQSRRLGRRRLRRRRRGRWMELDSQLRRRKRKLRRRRLRRGSMGYRLMVMLTLLLASCGSVC